MVNFILGVVSFSPTALLSVTSRVWVKEAIFAGWDLCWGILPPLELAVALSEGITRRLFFMLGSDLLNFRETNVC